jgi:hypothetical protein
MISTGGEVEIEELSKRMLGVIRFFSFGLAAIMVVLCAGGAVALEGFPFSREDPRDIIGTQECGDCHDSEYETWKSTAHAESFSKLHRRKRASAIARKLGFKRGVKRDTRCLTCHFTSEVTSDGKREIAKDGVSCESCHGAGEPWKNIHNDKDRNRDERIKQSISLGMRPPSDFYAVVSNCYQCHIVAFEDLVNDGGHSTGTGDFDMAERVSSIRHNFLAARREGLPAHNQEASAEHRRVLAAAGIILRVEYSLRALAQATSADGLFFEESQERAEEALEELTDLVNASGRGDFKAMSRAVEGVSLKLGRSKGQLAAATALSKEARKFFSANPEAVDLAFIDAMAEAEEEEPEEFVEAVPDAGDEESGGTGPDVAPDKGSTSGGSSGPKADPKPPGPKPRPINAGGLAGKVRANQVRNKHKTLKASSCKSSCHESESEWWKDHAHSGSHERFLSKGKQHVKIANKLGISSKAMATGKSLCMNCHGTVVTKKQSKPVKDGVSCQSCHGAAGKFIKAHQDGDRAGYALGMNDLSQPSVRPKVCASCHIIDYKPLLEAGHPTGKDFDFVEGIDDITHWEPARSNEGAHAASFQKIASGRPIPSFTVAKNTGPPPRAKKPSTKPSSRPSTKPSTRPSSGGGNQPSARDRKPTRRTDSRRTRPPPAPEPDEVEEAGTLPPWPEAGPRATVEEEMRALQKRLQQIYDAIYGGTRR